MNNEFMLSEPSGGIYYLSPIESRRIIIDPWLDRLHILRTKILLGISSDKELEIYNSETNYTDLTPNDYEKRFIINLKIREIKENLNINELYNKDYISDDWEYRYNLDTYNRLIDEYSYTGVLVRVTHIIKVGENHEKRKFQLQTY